MLACSIRRSACRACRQLHTAAARSPWASRVIRIPVPPQSEQSAAGFAALSMPASIALARRPFRLPRAAVAHRHLRGKVEMYVILWEFVVLPEKVDAFI